MLEPPDLCAPRAALRLAGALRGSLTPLCAALDAGADCPALSGAARTAACRLLRTAQNLECCARLQRPLPPGPCADLAAVTAAICEAAQLCCAHRRLRPALRAEGGVLPVALPAWVLAVVALNLLDNALLYGGPQPAARVEARRQGKHAVLTVRDAGPGIPPAAQSRAFAPFAPLPAPLRAKAAQPRPAEAHGAGLGLSLAALAARRAGGVCTLASRPGRGTAVAVSLPLCEGAMPGPCPTAAELLADRYSPVYLQLCEVCVLPEP